MFESTFSTIVAVALQAAKNKTGPHGRCAIHARIRNQPAPIEGSRLKTPLILRK